MDVLPPTAINLFKIIKDNLDFKTNEATLGKPKSKVEQKRRSNATKILKNHGAIKKRGDKGLTL